MLGALKPDAALWICVYHHLPAQHLKVTWHTDDHGLGAVHRRDILGAVDGRSLTLF
ncbi:MAG: hypothetical protein IT436_13290 [Phycisphaerales bacterium]|nr:hypothetical protein [Phycisphaerales bacterium]